MQRTEVRNGEWVTVEWQLGAMFSDLDDDTRTPEQMRLDMLTERVARAYAGSDIARRRANAGGALYAEDYAAWQALETEAATILDVVGVLRGDEAKESIRETALRLWPQLPA